VSTPTTRVVAPFFGWHELVLDGVFRVAGAE
jgi:hypothetical protein